MSAPYSSPLIAGAALSSVWQRYQDWIAGKKSANVIAIPSIFAALIIAILWVSGIEPDTFQLWTVETGVPKRAAVWRVPPNVSMIFAACVIGPIFLIFRVVSI